MGKIEKLLVLALLSCYCRSVSFLFQGNNFTMPDRQPVDPNLPATQIYEQVRVSPSCQPSLMPAPTPGLRTSNPGRIGEPGPWANIQKLESPILYGTVRENNNGYVIGQQARLLGAVPFGELTLSASKDVFVPVLPPPYDPRPTITYAKPQPVNVVLQSPTEYVPTIPQPPITVGFDPNSYIPTNPNYPQVPQVLSSNQPDMVDGVIASPSPTPSSMGIVSELPDVASIKTSYGDYVQIFKPYSSRTDGKYVAIYRQILFNERVSKINQHNANRARTYNMGLNLFTDRNQQELRQLYSNFKPISRAEIRVNLVDPRSNFKIMTRSMPSAEPPINRVPDNNQRISSMTDPDPWNIDWRCVGSPVYFIGDCGACSFFSTIDALYISLRIWGYYPATYSFQAPLSCMNPNFQNVCLNGGNFLYVYEYVRKYGVGAGSAYPYTDTYNAIDASPCNIDKLKSSAYRKKLIYTQQTYLIEENDCREVVDQLRTRALTVAIIANSEFTNYKQGIFSYDPSLQEDPNHAVVLMGYNPTKGYLIKNMWGSLWGTSGYAYLPRESGVCTWAVYAKQLYQLN